MVFKKIRNMLIGLLVVFVMFIGGKFYLNNKYHIQTHAYIPKANQEYKIDLTEFKVKQILNTNKIQSLEVTINVGLTDIRYDHSKVKFLDGIFKALTSRQLEISSDYKAIFSFDLSKAQFADNKDGTYVITLNANDIESNLVQIDTPKSKENMSLIGRYYSADIVAELTYKLQTMAQDKVNTYDNRVKSLQSTKDSLLNLLDKFGIDNNKIKIVIEGV